MLVLARRLPTTIVDKIKVDKTGITTMPPPIIPVLPLSRICPGPESLPPTVTTDLLTLSGVFYRHNHHITRGDEACLESPEKRIAEIRIVLVAPGTHPGKKFILQHGLCDEIGNIRQILGPRWAQTNP
jgi:hypothetical protein